MPKRGAYFQKVHNMKQSKFIYWRVLQSNHGYGWDDVMYFNLADSTLKERKQAMKEYRTNQPKTQHRFIDRRELKQNGI